MQTHPPSKPILFTAASLLMSALFWISAALQFNDPDPISWILLYSAAAITSLLAPWRPLIRWPAALTLAVCLPWLTFLLLQVVGVISFSDLFLKMNEKGGAVEVGREAGGLSITSLWMLFLLLRSPTYSALRLK